MTENLQTIKDVAVIAAPLSAAIVETWIKPKLIKLQKYLTADKALFENALSTKFEEYLGRTYERFSFINVLAFQNQPKKLDEIYVPLTIHKATGNIRIVIDGYKNNFLPEYKKVLIRDTAGMGKSTLLKFLCLSCIKNNRGIPVFIELRKLKNDESVFQYIYNELNPLDDEFDKTFILQLIKQGDFVFFLDGYDEIPFSQRNLVTQNLQEFISKADKNVFLLSSRPETSLASFQSFHEFNIQPLKIKEAFRLLKRYDRGGELSTEIIENLKADLLENIKEFLTNPFLVSLLYKSYEYKHTIPFRKHVFYRQMYDALFESHDLTKGGFFIREKYSKLDSETFHALLRALGFVSVTLGQIEFDKDHMLSLLRRAREQCIGLDVNEAEVLKDLITTVPLFNHEGNYYKWSHKSIQEYFAAQFICVDAKGLQAAALRKMAEGKNIEKYFNVLDLCYDMDYKTFRQTLMYDLIDKFLRYYDFKTKGLYAKGITQDAINERKVLTFSSQSGFTVRNAAHASELNKLRARDYFRATGLDIDQYFYDEEIDQLIIFTKEEEVLIKFLGHKQEAIVDFIGMDDQELLQQEEEEYTSLSTPREEMVTIKQVLEVVNDDFCIISEDPSSILNQFDLFFAVNTMLRLGHTYIMNPYKSRLVKWEIENELQKERSNTLLQEI